MTAAFVNGQRAVKVRLLTPRRGVWLADVDLDPDDPTVIPSGRVVIKIGDTITLSGTVDPVASGRFGASAQLRVVGGGGGWDNPVPSQHFDGAGSPVLSTTVYQATAAVVGEVVIDATPIPRGPTYTRTAGPASRVLRDRDWFVDALGVTNIGVRLAGPPDASVEILGFDVEGQRLECSGEALIQPGTTFTDSRFDGPLVASDVEQTFDAAGARANVAVTTNAASRLLAALASLVRELDGREYLRVYRYRYVLTQAGGLALQVINAAKGTPDVLDVSVAPATAGLACKPTPGQTALVVFLEGDPTQPRVIGFDTTLPLEATIDATTAVHVGPTAPSVDVGAQAASVAIAGGSDFVALATQVATELAKIKATLLTGTSATGGAVSFTTPYAPGSVAATRTKAT